MDEDEVLDPEATVDEDFLDSLELEGLDIPEDLVEDPDDPDQATDLGGQSEGHQEELEEPTPIAGAGPTGEAPGGEGNDQDLQLSVELLKKAYAFDQLQARTKQVEASNRRKAKAQGWIATASTLAEVDPEEVGSAAGKLVQDIEREVQSVFIPRMNQLETQIENFDFQSEVFTRAVAHVTGEKYEEIIATADQFYKLGSMQAIDQYVQTGGAPDQTARIAQLEEQLKAKDALLAAQKTSRNPAHRTEKQGGAGPTGVRGEESFDDWLDTTLTRARQTG